MIKTFILLFTLILLTSMSLYTAPQDQEHEKIVEKVTVTNVEVPVRVLLKGKPVGDLSKDDFILYENKKKMTINGFYKINKTLTFKQPAPGEAAPAPELPPRTFVLVFNVSNYNRYFEKAINHLFDTILRPNDRVLVFANDKTREYPNVKEKEKIKAQLVADLKEEGIKAKRRLLEYINRVETYMNVHEFRRKLHKRDTGQASRMIDFMKKYYLTWKDYQQTYLTPKPEKFYYFSRYLEKLKGQKWVLNFYQFEFFPRIRVGSQAWEKIRDLASELQQSNNPTLNARAQQMFNLINKINSELVLNARFPKDEISKLFYKVDATFHSFFIKSMTTAFMQNLDYNEVSSELEEILKSITDITGGKNITSSDLVKSLEIVKEVEDVYYVLTYAPTNPKKAGKLKIKTTKGRKYKVLYDDNFRADYINDYFNKLEKKIETPDVKIKDFSFKKKILAFNIVDFMMTKIDGKTAGRIKIRIRLNDKNNVSLFDQAKILTAQKTELKVSLPVFKSIKKGDYHFLIDALDMVTQKEENFHQAVRVKR
jgi:hypothetical protein